MFQKIRNSKISKTLVVFLAINFVNSILYPNIALALTAGPSLPEVQSFEPVGTNQMVDLFSGDFTYNIPLFEVPGPHGGYPFNLAYHSGVGMDQEASWVGLGWSLNPGAINRTVRGYPDDFTDGDNITNEVSMKPNITLGGSFAVDAEIFGADLKKVQIGDQLLQSRSNSINFNTKLYFNNYKGWGFGIGFGAAFAKNRLTTGVGINFDSQSGSGVSLNVTPVSIGEKTQAKFGFGIGLNSKRGLNLSQSLTLTDPKVKDRTGKTSGTDRSIGGSSSISFAENSFSPAMTYEMSGFDVYGMFTWGAGFMGAYADYTVGGFFNQQSIKDNEEDVPCYGYMYLHEPFDNPENNNNGRYLLDFMREKDGLVTDRTPNLAIPNLTYDYYMIQGQGTGGMFRPYRSDYGHVHDPRATSTTNGIMLGVDIGGLHWGVAGSYSNTTNRVGEWKDDNDDNENGNDGNHLQHYKFSAKNTSDPEQQQDVSYEPVYFKVRGEYTSINQSELNAIGGEQAVPVPVSYSGATGSGILGTGDGIPNNRYAGGATSRVPRNTAILPVLNEDLSPNCVIKEYELKYFSSSYDLATLPLTPNVDFTRTDKPKHVAGYTTTDPSGKRYVYALPAMNNTKKEHLFSVDNPGNPDQVRVGATVSTASASDRFSSVTTTGEYAHAYMLTSVLGADYVDVDNNGPSDDDYGYWVKFNYVRKQENYKWRAPFQDANYDPGLRSYGNDDKGSFVEGEKELWYVASVETKTHIAYFEIEARTDGKESGGANNHTYRLNTIKLYTKNDIKEHISNSSNPAVPLKTIHFKYADDTGNTIDELCNGIVNSTGTRGKLTLEKVYYTYQNSEKGRLSPYTFEYGQYRTPNDVTGIVDHTTLPAIGVSNPTTEELTSNPPYHENRYDRWGNYKCPISYNAASKKLEEVGAPYEAELRNFPYVQQSAKNVEYSSDLDDVLPVTIDGIKKQFKQLRDKQSMAWHLSTIGLPSGGKIYVDYESDDYAYVQHRQATQMFNITNSDGAEGNINVATGNQPEPADRRIYFKLEEPVKVVEGTEDLFKQMYLDGMKRAETDYNADHDGGMYQLYFKVLSTLKGGNQEYISGYAKLEMNAGNQGFANTANIGGEQYFTHGFVTVSPQKIKTGKYYHPFAAAGWQFIRNSAPKMLQQSNAADAVDAVGGNNSDRIGMVQSMMNAFLSARDLFMDYTTIASNQGWANRIDGSKSVIRLCSPDKRKYGGGTRVKQLTLSDNWTGITASAEPDKLYGTVYDYSMEENGKQISSGVATYEPMIGADENPLRWAKPYSQNVPFASDNNVFFEYPINESLYPGESVGYRQVKQYSLNSYLKIKDPSRQYDATGYSVHEFYTAKDYPVFTHETDISLQPDYFPYYIPFIGMIEKNNLTAGQGYSIVLNDMHGKARSVKNYAQPVGDQPHKLISSMEYIYDDIPMMYEGALVRKLKNEEMVLVDESPKMAVWDEVSGNEIRSTEADKTYTKGVLLTDQKLIGVDYEFFSDMRYARSFAMQGGVDFNTEVFPIFGIPVPWPNTYESTNNLKTAVTNKVIHRAGILMKTIAVDGTSTIETENVLFDKSTGRALLSKTTTQYPDIYKYGLVSPAYYKYNELGNASASIGIEAVVSSISDYSESTLLSIESDVYDKINNGDELLVTINDQKIRSIAKKDINSSGVFIPGSGYSGNAKLKIIRPQNTNQLLQDAGYTEYLGELPYWGIPEDVDINDNVDELYRSERPYFHVDEHIRYEDVLTELSNYVTNNLQHLIESGTPLGGNGSTEDLYVNRFVPAEYTLVRTFFEKISFGLFDYDYAAQEANSAYGAFSCEQNELTPECIPQIELCTGNNSHIPNPMIPADYDCGCIDNSRIYQPSLHIHDSHNQHFEPVVIMKMKIHPSALMTLFFPGNNDILRDWTIDIKIPLPGHCNCWCQGFDCDNIAQIIYRIDFKNGYVNYRNYVLDYNPYDKFYFEVLEGQDYITGLDVVEHFNMKKNVLNASAIEYFKEIQGNRNLWYEGIYYNYNDYRKYLNPSNYGYNGFYINKGHESDCFFNFSWNPSIEWPIHQNWIPINTVTKYKNGFPVEQVDEKGIYSSVIYGFNNTVPIMVANNAKETDLFFEDFEEFSHAESGTNSRGTYVSTYVYNSTDNPHTGEKYLSISTTGTGLIKNDDVRLRRGKTYVFSAWNRGDYYDEFISSFSVMVDNDGTYELIPYATKKYSNGLYRTFATFSVNEDVPLSIRTGGPSRVDDIMIYPTGAEVKAYVYDKETMRLRAELNGENFATIYEYDEAGNLFLVKQETDEGIKTLQESRIHSFKQ